MAFTIQQRTTVINPNQKFTGTYDVGLNFASINLKGTVTGPGGYNTTYNASTVSPGNWWIEITNALSVDGMYTLTMNGAGIPTTSMSFEYAGPLFEDTKPNGQPGDVPTFTLPANESELPVIAAAAAATQGEFMAMTADTSSSCDLLGTVQGLASEVSRTVKDAAGTVIGVVKESTATLTASIRESLGDAFGGSGSFLNTIKGYAAKAVDWVKDVKDSMMASVGDAQQWARSKIQAAQATIAGWLSTEGEGSEGKIAALIKSVRSGIASVKQTVSGFISAAQTKLAGLMTSVKSAAATLQGMISGVRAQVSKLVGIVGDCVTGIAQATCSTLTTVLAGSPSDAFANITSGAADAATKAFGAAKSAFNAGADNLAAVKAKIVDATGVGDVFSSVKDTAGTMATNITNTATSFASTTSSGATSLYSTINSRPVMPA